MIVANASGNWRERRRTLACLRREWSEPEVRNRDLTAIASYHCAFAARDPESSIDDRTWRDLDLDDVYGVLDRTVSSIGQQILYHRFRWWRSDELFQGTNAVERIAAGEPTLAELADSKTPHVTVAATDDVELVALLTPTCTAFHFSDDVSSGELVLLEREQPI